MAQCNGQKALLFDLMHEMANASWEICMSGVVQVTEEVVRKISMFRAMMNKIGSKG